jgi:NADPH:quinone reductase
MCPFSRSPRTPAAGRLDIKPVRIFGFDEIQEASRVLEANQAGGKIIGGHD